MRDGNPKRTPFRFDYSLPVVERLVAGPVVIALAIVAVACAVGVTGQWRRGEAGTDLSDVVLLSAAALLCTFGVGAWIWGWIERRSWCLGVDDGTLYWSSKGKEKLLPCDSISTITIRTSGDWPDMTIVTADGTRESVPSKCLGDFDKFCEAIHTFAPQAIVTFDGCGTCEVCGKPTRTSASCYSEGHTATHYFCKAHKPG